MKLGVILHGAKNNRHAQRKEIEAVFSEWSLDIRVTEYDKHAEKIARELCNDTCDAVLVCGGDGSLNQAANGVFSSNNPNTPLAIWPSGTGNDFVKTLEVPQSFQDLKTSIEQSNFKAIDLPCMEWDGRKRVYLNVTDLGLGGCVAYDMMRSKRRLGAFLTYQWLIVKNLVRFKKRSIHFNLDGKNYDARAMNFVVANARYFGSGLGISPESQLTDGLLEVIVIGDLNIFEYLYFVPKVRKCKKLSYHKIQYYSTKKISIETEVPMPIDMDGEFVGFSPLIISIQHSLNVVVRNDREV
ncbi:MAG: diacylglycerol kinase family lipid kinase [Flavobacteriales bacterium]|jgi:diacylglycerol kinase (ATP)|nr:diacylglycerol kinase family lipid kinase [Flavobacteriales bacterium]MDP4951075.1 diacylglycerol kinase family lipid kinase [Flavobacteriales bacterium]